MPLTGVHRIEYYLNVEGYTSPASFILSVSPFFLFFFCNSFPPFNPAPVPTDKKRAI